MPSSCSLLKKLEENYDAEKATLEHKRPHKRKKVKEEVSKFF